MLWLRLTNHDGKPIRINMSIQGCYYPFDGDNGKTFIEGTATDEEGNIIGNHVRETIEQIDAALAHSSSPLRIGSGW